MMRRDQHVDRHEDDNRNDRDPEVHEMRDDSREGVAQHVGMEDAMLPTLNM